MNCAFCQRTNDAEAIFCVYCGIRMETLPTPIAPAAPPATGATIDLGRAAAQPTTPPMPTIKPVTPPPLGRMPAPVATRNRGHGGGYARHRHHNNQWLGFVLAALVVMFMLKNLLGLLLPMALVGLGVYLLTQSAPRHRRRSRDKRAAVWLVGLGIVAITGFWPGIFMAWMLASSIR